MGQFLDSVNNLTDRLALFADMSVQDTQKSYALKMQIGAIKKGIALALLMNIACVALAILLGIQTTAGIVLGSIASVPLIAIIVLGKKYFSKDKELNQEMLNIEAYLDQFHLFFKASYRARVAAINEKLISKKHEFQHLREDESFDQKFIEIRDDQDLIIEKEHRWKVKDVTLRANAIKKLPCSHPHLSKVFKKLKGACTLFLEGKSPGYSLDHILDRATLLHPNQHVNEDESFIYNLRVISDAGKDRLKTNSQLDVESKLKTKRATLVILAITTLALAVLGTVGLILGIYSSMSIGLLGVASLPFLAFFIRKLVLHCMIRKEQAWVVALLKELSEKYKLAYEATRMHMKTQVDNKDCDASNFQKFLSLFLKKQTIANKNLLFWKEVGEKLLKTNRLPKTNKFAESYNRLLEQVYLFVNGDPQASFYCKEINQLDGMQELIFLPTADAT